MWLKQALVRTLGSELLFAPYGRRKALGAVTVLMYHELGEDDDPIDAWTVVRRRDFMAQIDHLRAHYDIVSLDDALEATTHGSAHARPLAVLTFDDGDAGNHDVLLPIVERERLPVTIYIATRQIEDQHGYWFDRVINAVQGNVAVEIDLRAEGLDRYRINRIHGAPNWAVIQRLLTALKGVDPKRREILADAIVERAHGKRTPVRPLTIEHIIELAANPYVTIGAHSHCHNLLPQIPLPEARESITQSRDLLERWTDRKVRHFAYPNGDFTTALKDAVKTAGFATAACTRRALWTGADDLMAIPRIGVGRYDALSTFKFTLIRSAIRPRGQTYDL